MATYQSDIIKAKASLDVSGKSLSGEKTGAHVLYATAEYVVKPTAGSPTEIANDVIELADVPAGATVVPHLCYVSKTVTNKSLTLQLGDTTDATRYGGVTTGSDDSMGKLSLPYPHTAQFGTSAGFAERYEKQTRICAKITAIDATMPAGTKLKFGIAYRVQG